MYCTVLYCTVLYCTVQVLCWVYLEHRVVFEDLLVLGFYTVTTVTAQ